MIARAVRAVSLALCLTLPALAAPGGAFAREPKRIALVIGNENYVADDWELTTPADDATLVGRALDAAGFDTVVVINAGDAELTAALRRFGERLAAAGPNPAAFFYYAGHAARTRGDVYLLPVDAAEVRRDGLRLDSVLDAVERAGEGRRFVVLDVCRATPLIASDPETEACAARPPRRRDPPFIAYSAGLGETVADAEAAPSAFAASLSAALDVPGLASERAFEQLVRETAAATGGAQHPWTDVGERGDAFFFARPTEADYARRVAETIAWDRARLAGASSAFEVYLTAYPRGRFASDALSRIALANAEAADAETEASVPSAAFLAEQVEPSQTLVGLGKFRVPDAQDLLVLDTTKGRLLIEMIPELAPATVARVRELAREGYFDGAPFLRVVESYLAEVRLREPEGRFAPVASRGLLAAIPIAPTPIAIADQDRSRLGVYADGDFGFGLYKGLAIAQGEDSQTLVSHCPGVVSRVRGQGQEADSLYIMLGEAPALDPEAEPWGRVIEGLDAAYDLAAADPLSLSPQADAITRARVASDLSPGERNDIYASFGAVLDETSPGFAEFVASLRETLGRAPRVCEIRLPNSGSLVRQER